MRHSSHGPTRRPDRRSWSHLQRRPESSLFRARQSVHGPIATPGCYRAPETPSDRTTGTVASHPRSLVHSLGEPGGSRFSYRVNAIAGVGGAGLLRSPRSSRQPGPSRRSCFARDCERVGGGGRRCRLGRIVRAFEPHGLRRPLRYANDSLTRALACKLTGSNSLEAEVRSDPELAGGKDEERHGRWGIASTSERKPADVGPGCRRCSGRGPRVCRTWVCWCPGGA
jgi:hypothetical protein